MLAKRFIGTLALALYLTCACAQTAADFLSLTPDARAAGVGSAAVALSPDASAQHHNVARYAFAPAAWGAALSYIPWTLQNAGDMAVYYAAGFHRFERNAVSASVRYHRMGDIILTPDGQNFTTQSLGDYAVDVGYSRQITRLVAAGVALRYVSVARAEQGGMASAGALAADVGAYLRLPLEQDVASAGLSLTNVGTKPDFGDNLTLSLPMSLTLGAGYTFNAAGVHSAALLLGAEQPLVAERSGEGVSLRQSLLSAGVEYGFRQMVFARVGYAYNDEQHGDRSHLAFGAGVLIRGIALDAAYLYSTSKRDNALVNTVRVTLSFVAGKGEKDKKARLQPLNPCNTCP